MAKFLMRTCIVSAAVVIAGVGVESAAPLAAANPEVRRVVRQVTVPAGTVLRLRVNRGLAPTFHASRIRYRPRWRALSLSAAEPYLVRAAWRPDTCRRRRDPAR
jgi:hypothetical protein